MKFHRFIIRKKPSRKIFSQGLFDATSLSYISFPAYHSLSHPGDVLGPHVLGCVHFAVIDDALPWVAGVLGSLHAVGIVLRLLLVNFGPALFFSFALLFPLVKGLLAGDFSLVFGSFFTLHFFVELPFSILLLKVDSLYDF